MKPWLSQTRWIFVPNPPRERPNAWSDGSCSCVAFDPPNRRGPPGFFFRPRRRTTGSNDRAIDTPKVVVDLTPVVEFVQERGGDADPGAVLTPPIEGREDRLPGAVTLGEITPGGAGMEDPEDAINDRPGIVEGVACAAAMSPVRQEGRDPSPLLLGEFIAAHGRTRWGNGPVWTSALPIIILLRTIAKQRLVYV